VAKPLFDFARKTDSIDGFRKHCKQCSNKASKLWYDANSDYVRQDKYIRKYGLTTEQVLQMAMARLASLAVAGNHQPCGWS
jgi:hypothetical protein